MIRAGPRQHGDRLDVRGVGEHVHGLDAQDTIAGLDGERELAGENAALRRDRLHGLDLGRGERADQQSGALIERIGYSLTISLCAVIGLVFTLLIGMKWRASMWAPEAATGAPATAER